MSGQQQQQSQQVPMQNSRMVSSRGGNFPVYGMQQTRQMLVPMQTQISQQQRMTNQTRYIISRPPAQNNQAQSESQQMHSSASNLMQIHGFCSVVFAYQICLDGTVVSIPPGTQVYHHGSGQNAQIMHQMSRNQSRQQVQIMQQQGTSQPQNFNNSMSCSPNMHGSASQHQQYSNQVDQRHYSQQPVTQQDRQVHQRMQQQTMQRSMTPQQQHVSNSAQLKSTQVISKTSSMQNLNDGNLQDQHYIVQTAVPTSVYNVVQGQSNQQQIMHVGDNQQQEMVFTNNNQQIRQGGSFQIRHPVTQRPLQFTNQTANTPIVRYTYPAGQQSQSTQSVVIQPIQQSRNGIRPNASNRPQYIQVVRTEADAQRATYRIANADPNYAVSSAPNVFYRTSGAPQQTNFAIRQALNTENNYQQQIQASNPPVIIHSIDNSNGQLVYKLPNPLKRHTSSDNFESSNFVQPHVVNNAENVNVDYSIEPVQRNNSVEEDLAHRTPINQEEVSAPKKPRLSAKPTAPKQPKASKAKKAPNKPIPNKSIPPAGPSSDTVVDDSPSEANNTVVGPLLTKTVIEQVAKSISQSLTLEDDAKCGVLVYMEDFVNNLIEETCKATKHRKSKHIELKDVNYALRTKFNINPNTSATSSIVASKLGK